MAFFGGAPFSFTARFVSGVLALLLQMSEFSFASLASLLARGVAGASPGDCSAQDSVGAGGTSSFTADPLTSTGDFWGHRSAPAGSGARGSGEQGRGHLLQRNLGPSNRQGKPRLRLWPTKRPERQRRIQTSGVTRQGLRKQIWL
uniref:Putative secreted protein n=1 Tax=Ixodes ricinus TaxID=34613 RepID=A0A6B0UV07_IXORI